MPSSVPRHRLVLAAVVSLVAAALSTVAAPAAVAAPSLPAPVLLPAPTVTPATVTGGSIATVTGAGCRPKGPTHVYLSLLDTAGATTSTTAVTPAADGTWTAHLTPAVSATPGRYQVSATCDTYNTAAPYRPRALTVAADTAAPWTTQTPALPDVPNGNLADVDCVDATSCVAVGTVAVAGHPTTLVETWDGTVWSVATVAPSGVGGDVTLTSVDCASSTRCVAVGEVGAVGGRRALSVLLTGTTWTSQVLDLPTGLPEATLNGVSCPTTKVCLAVGTAGNLSEGSNPRPVAYRLQGTTWTRVADPVTPGQSKEQSMQAVSCADAKTCVAVGSYTAYFPTVPVAEVWDGTTWQLLQLPQFTADVQPRLADISCATTSSCAAVGGINGAGSFDQQPLVLTLTDATWRQATVDVGSAPAGPLRAVSCTRSGCTAVGGVDGNSSQQALAVSGRGTTWTGGAVDLPDGTGGLSGVSCGVGACLAVGTSDARPVAVRSSGSGYVDTGAVTPSGYVGGEFDAVSCSGPAACTAVGWSWDATQRTTAALVNRWDGTRWTPQDLPFLSDAVLSGVACPSAKVCYAVGAVGRGRPSSGAPVLLQWRGGTWTVVTVRGISSGSLTAVSCSSTSACLAVGQSGPFSGEPVVVALTSGTWKAAAVPASGLQSVGLSGVSCVGGRCHVTGTGYDTTFSAVGLDLVWDGSALTAGPPVAPVDAVSCTSLAVCVATPASRGDRETASQRLTDGTWNAEALPDPSGYLGGVDGVSCRGTSTCVVVGVTSGGPLVAVRTGDGTWVAQPVATLAGHYVSLAGVSQPTDSTAVAVGHDGAPVIVVSPRG